MIRRRTVGGGFHEELTILNHSDKPVRLEVRLDAGCDFADLFEVKDALKKKGKYYARVTGGRLVLGYERKTFRRETSISASTPAKVDRNGLTFTVRLKPQASWQTELDVVPVLGSYAKAGVMTAAQRRSKLTMEQDLRRWLDDAPRVECDWEPLKATYRRSLIDMAALRFSPPVAGGASLPAAGLPWFMTMFGRDSIFTSLQAVPFAPDLAATTLRALGAWQGTGLDDFRDEDPGRILHEMRYGEMTAFEERPHSPYYGSADATPLYVVLLDEYERWTGDRRTVRELEHEARAALNWIDEYADLLGTGYVWYQRRNEKTGLENQCWKDSWDSISYRDGRLPGFPRATCELQGYAYDAKLRGARLARLVWKDPDFADRLEREAADLKRRFNRDFWVEDGEYFALALDTEGKQVDALASNNGHLLWSGIVDQSKAKAVARAPAWSEALLRLGRAHAGGRRSALQPHRLPRRHGLAVRQLVHRVGLAPVRLQGGGSPSRLRHPRRGRFLRRALARGVRWLSAPADEVPGAVPDGVQPAGMVDRDAVAAAADHAGPRAQGRASRDGPGTAEPHRPSGTARHPWAVGSNRRVRSRASRR